MKKLVFILTVILLGFLQVKAQNPYAALGIEEQVLYYDDTHEEVFGNDSIKTIGYAIYDRVNGLTSLFDLTDSLVASQKIDPSKMARFLSVDPIAREYPWYTPYQFAGNKVIWAVDLDGLEEYYAADGSFIGKSGTSTEIRIIADNNIIPVAKNNLSDPKNNHQWLITHSEIAYISNEKNERKLLNDWAVEIQPKIDDIEFTMSIFSKTLTDAKGNKFDALIKGTTEQGYKNSKMVSMLLSKAEVNGKDLESSGWKRIIAIHNHPGYYDSDFSDSNGGFLNDADIPTALKNNIKVYLVTKEHKFIKEFSPERYYNYDNNATINKMSKKFQNPYIHADAVERAVDKTYIYIMKEKKSD